MRRTTCVVSPGSRAEVSEFRKTRNVDHSTENESRGHREVLGQIRRQRYTECKSDSDTRKYFRHSRSCLLRWHQSNCTRECEREEDRMNHGGNDPETNITSKLDVSRTPVGDRKDCNRHQQNGFPVDSRSEKRRERTGHRHDERKHTDQPSGIGRGDPNLSLTWGRTPIMPISVVMIPNTPNARTGINNFDFTTHSSYCATRARNKYISRYIDMIGTTIVAENPTVTVFRERIP